MSYTAGNSAKSKIGSGRFYAVATRRDLFRNFDTVWVAQHLDGIRRQFPSEAKALEYAQQACRNDKTLRYPRAERCG